MLAIEPIARADNPMGYRLLSQQEASSLPRNGGALGLDVERASQVTDDGLTFDIIRIKQVRRGSPGAQAGFNTGDQIIAIDGRVFPSLFAFADYVASRSPSSRISVDYIPAGGDPQQAQRISVLLSENGKEELETSARSQNVAPAPAGMSTGTKVAIGVGAAALLGCYELGCFSHKSNLNQPSH